MPADPRRVKDLFVAALDLPDDAARRAFLDRECADDADLRRRLGVLFAAHTHDPATSTFDPTALPATAAHEPSAAAGTVVGGRYKLVEPIGDGGMGSVWMAQQTEPVKRLVAVKLIKAGMDSRQVLARFEAERQALALMDHPNIARVLDAGATEQGRPFFVMELVKGVPVTKFCDDRKLTPRERLELFVPVCQAIQHAHQKGVIHRDIKPSNVLVALYDGRPVPKVIDFGIAKAAGQPLTDKTLVTGFGAVVGTPEYMSPEQAEFNQLDIDTRSDVYSLGVLLYELLAGSPPFPWRELGQAGLLEILRVIRETEPPRPSTRLSTSVALPSLAANRGTEPKALTGLLRSELDWVVMKALEKDRTRRYDTANAFAADVQRYLAGEQVQAVPPSAGYRVRKWVRRNRAVAATAAAVVLVLVLAPIAAGLGYLWQAAVAERSRAEGLLAEVQDEQAKTAAALAGERRAAAAAEDARERLERVNYVRQVERAHQEWRAGRVAAARAVLAACPERLRGWEWRYADRVCHPEAVVLPAEEDDHACHFGLSPDGRRIAYSGPDGFVVREFDSGRVVYHAKGVSAFSAAFSPDGKRVAWGVGGSSARVVDLATGDVVKLDRPDGTFRTDGVEFSPDGRHVAAIGIDPSLWDAATGARVHELKSGDDPQSRGRYFPDGKSILVPTTGGVCVLDPITNVPVTREAEEIECGRPAIAPDGGRVVLVTRTGAVLTRPDLTGPRTAYPHGGKVLAVAADWAGGRVATGGEDRLVKVWNLADGRLLDTLVGCEAEVTELAFRAGTDQLVSGEGDEVTRRTAVRVWELGGPRHVRSVHIPVKCSDTTHWGFSAAFDQVAVADPSVDDDEPVGKASLARRTRLALADTRTGRLVGGPVDLPDTVLAVRPVGGGVVRAVAVADELKGKEYRSFPGYRFPVWHHRVEVAGRPSLRTLTFPPGKSAAVELPGEVGEVVAAEFSGDGTRAVVVTQRHVLEPTAAVVGVAGAKAVTLQSIWLRREFVSVYATDTGREALSLALPFISRGATLDPTGRTLGLLSEKGEFHAYDGDTGRPTARVELTNDYATFLTVAPGRSAALGMGGNLLIARDLAPGAAVVTIPGFALKVSAPALGPDGRLIAAGGEPGLVRVWDVSTGAVVLALPVPGTAVRVAFSDDGTRLFALCGGPDKGSSVVVFDARPR